MNCKIYSLDFQKCQRDYFPKVKFFLIIENLDLGIQEKQYSKVRWPGQFSFEMGRPRADWGPNSFGDNLIWVGRQGQIWKSFKYVHWHLDWDQHHYHWRSTREILSSEDLRRYIWSSPVISLIISPNVRTYHSIQIHKSWVKNLFAK